MSRPSRWGWFWIALTLTFILADILASWGPHKKPRSASEHFWHLFPRGWKRALGIALLSLLFWHLASGPDVRPFDVGP
jgi:hypothetical protein